MIYYPAEEISDSWAHRSLQALGYNRNPTKLQSVIKKAFEEATSHIQISGSQVIPVPLFNVLDGKHSNDYVARVEPSALGGKKMAEYLLDTIQHDSTSVNRSSIAAPTTKLISDR